MTDAVWKFVVPGPNHNGRAYIDAPVGSEFLSVGIQCEQMVVWARIEPPFEGRREMRRHRLIVLNTGQEVVPFTGRFLGTVTAGEIVWHVWDGESA